MNEPPSRQVRQGKKKKFLGSRGSVSARFMITGRYLFYSSIALYIHCETLSTTTKRFF